MVTYKVTLMVRKIKLGEEGNEYIPLPILGGEDVTIYSVFTLEHDWVQRLPAEAVRTIILDSIESGLPEVVGLMKVDASK